MFVETFLHFREFLEAVFTSLSRGDQKYAALLFPWIDNNKNKNTGVNQGDLDNVITWLNDNVLPQAGYNVRGDVYQSINFLAAINKGRAAQSLYTVAGCSFWENYWYDGSCHSERKFVPVIEPEPEPEPEPVIDEERPFKPVIEPEYRDCSEWLDRGSCAKMGCYWYRGKCYDSIEDYLEKFMQWNIIHHRLDVSNDAVKNQMNYMKALTEFFINDIGVNAVFAQEAAVYQLLGVQVEDSVNSAFASIDHIVDRIGAIEELDGKTIVEAIRAGGGGADEETKWLAAKLASELGYTYNWLNDTIYPFADGFADRINQLLAYLTDEQGNYVLPTLDKVRKMLADDYELFTSTVRNIKEKNDYVFEQVKGVETDTGRSLRQIIQELLVSVSGIIDVVSGEIDRPILEDSEIIEWLVPASVGWVKDKLKAVGNIIFDAIEETTTVLAEQINKIGTIVVSMPDWWIEDLKERLGI